MTARWRRASSPTTERLCWSASASRGPWPDRVVQPIGRTRKFRHSLRRRGLAPGDRPLERWAHHQDPRATGCAASSSRPPAASRISAASPPATTRQRATSSPLSASSQPSPAGNDRGQSLDCSATGPPRPRRAERPSVRTAARATAGFRLTSEWLRLHHYPSALS